ncbi:MAG: hypothetical protein LBK68_05500 [Candidatus Margulisbacteria bacterium]|jgi:hypothetical protein|nr:hypothetical protein [Candidatus Margulisiibacteriota bacterium]
MEITNSFRVPDGEVSGRSSRVTEDRNPYYNKDTAQKTEEKEPWFGTLGNGKFDGWKDIASAAALPFALVSPVACTPQKQQNVQSAVETPVPQETPVAQVHQGTEIAGTPVDLSKNFIGGYWGNTIDLIDYSIQNDTLTIQTHEIPDDYVVDAFFFNNVIKTDGHTKLVLTCLEKSGNFSGDHNIGFALEELINNSIKNTTVAPAGWNIDTNGFIANKQNAPAGEYYHVLSAGDELEFDISGKSEIFFSSQVILGSNGKLVFSFELRD